MPGLKSAGKACLAKTLVLRCVTTLAQPSLWNGRELMCVSVQTEGPTRNLQEYDIDHTYMQHRLRLRSSKPLCNRCCILEDRGRGELGCFVLYAVRLACRIRVDEACRTAEGSAPRTTAPGCPCNYASHDLSVVPMKQVPQHHRARTCKELHQVVIDSCTSMHETTLLHLRVYNMRLMQPEHRCL